MEINKVFKIGGSWTVAIPRKYFQDHGINLGDFARIKNKQGHIEIDRLHLKEKKEK